MSYKNEIFLMQPFTGEGGGGGGGGGGACTASDILFGLGGGRKEHGWEHTLTVLLHLLHFSSI